jgi:hypothetical protein
MTAPATSSAIQATRPAAQAPHVHLPELIEKAKKVLQGRRQSSIASLLKRPTFMQGWKVDLRYEGNGAVALAQFQQWRDDANRALAAANLRRQS